MRTSSLSREWLDKSIPGGHGRGNVYANASPYGKSLRGRIGVRRIHRRKRPADLNQSTDSVAHSDINGIVATSKFERGHESDLDNEIHFAAQLNAK